MQKKLPQRTPLNRKAITRRRPMRKTSRDTHAMFWVGSFCALSLLAFVAIFGATPIGLVVMLLALLLIWVAPLWIVWNMCNRKGFDPVLGVGLVLFFSWLGFMLVMFVLSGKKDVA